MSELTAALVEHYARRPDWEAIRENLRRKKIDLAQVRPQDLYPYDQLHVGGIQATRRLAERAQLQPRSCVVDVGCGAGGAARFLATELSCRVIGIELAPATLDTAVKLNRIVGGVPGLHLLAAKADALPLPAEFADVVWTQHVTMNLEDHRAFVREAARVLKPSGRLACHEWFRDGPGELPYLFPYPLPWAPTASLNRAAAASEFLEMLRGEDFAPNAEDLTAAMCEALRRDLEALRRHPNPPAGRIAALENLLQAASRRLLCCRIITAPRS